MMEKNCTLSYADEKDKTFGIAGMAITLVALDGEEYLGRIDLDDSTGESLAINRDLCLAGSPLLSAKIVWEQTLKDLRLTTSLALGNLICRRYVLSGRRLSHNEIEGLRKALQLDAEEHCGLDADEADKLFESCHGYVDRIFRHSGVADIASAFANELTRRRSLSSSETTDLLASLGLR